MTPDDNEYDGAPFFNVDLAAPEPGAFSNLATHVNNVDNVMAAILAIHTLPAPSFHSSTTIVSPEQYARATFWCEVDMFADLTYRNELHLNARFEHEVRRYRMRKRNTLPTFDEIATALGLERNERWVRDRRERYCTR